MQENNSNSKRKYDNEFKREAVRLVTEEDRKTSEVAMQKRGRFYFPEERRRKIEPSPFLHLGL